MYRNHCGLYNTNGIFNTLGGFFKNVGGILPVVGGAVQTLGGVMQGIGGSSTAPAQPGQTLPVSASPFCDPANPLYNPVVCQLYSQQSAVNLPATPAPGSFAPINVAGMQISPIILIVGGVIVLFLLFK